MIPIPKIVKFTFLDPIQFLNSMMFMERGVPMVMGMSVEGHGAVPCKAVAAHPESMTLSLVVLEKKEKEEYEPDAESDEE